MTSRGSRPTTERVRARARIAAVAAGISLFSIGLVVQPSVVLAATFTVNTTVDGIDDNIGNGSCHTAANTCSLRAAIQEANASNGADVITLPAGTYTLDVADAQPYNKNGSKSLMIGSNLTINGAGTGTTIIRGVYNGSTFDVEQWQGAAFGAAINNVTITGGYAATGGGVMVGVGVNLSLTDVMITGNTAGSYGGGIFVYGAQGYPASTVNLTRTTVTGNVSNYSGGGIVNSYPSVMNIAASTISSNVAKGAFAGGIRNNGEMTLTDTNVISNQAATGPAGAPPAGGGIYAGNPPSPQFGQTSTFTMSGGSIVNNSLPTNQLSSGGGFVNTTAGTATLTGVTISGNTAFQGGGILNNEGTVMLVNTTVASNSALFGAGIYNNDFAPTDPYPANFTVLRSAVVRNNATEYGCSYNLIPAGQTCGAGGGLFNENGLLVVADSTVAENVAANYGAGIYNLRIGSGTTSQAMVRLTNTTVSANWTSRDGGGLLNNGGTTQVRNTILADNIVGGRRSDCFPLSGAVSTSFGNNVHTDYRCGLTQGSDQYVSPLLTPLDSNGGPTVTMVPSTGSRAVDHGDNGACAGAPIANVDQRGQARPANGTCDVGAVEGSKARPTPNTTGRPAVSRGGQWGFKPTLTDGAPMGAALFGLASDRSIMCDFDGDGSSSLMIVRSTNGLLWWQGRSNNSNGPVEVSVLYGLATDTPICGDWDGNGTDTPGIVRTVGPSLTWYLSNKADGSGPLIAYTYGAAGDRPVTGDWDGNGTDSPGITRAYGYNMLWAIRNPNSTGNPGLVLLYGAASDTPIVGDWDGNGSDTFGVVRPDNGSLLWMVRNQWSSGYPNIAFHFGLPFDRPLVWRGAGMLGL